MIAGTIAEVTSLIHIKPDSINVDVFFEVVEPVLPPGDCLGLKEVRVDRVSWPYLTNEVLLIRALEEDILSDSIGVGVIALIDLSYSNVHDRDELAVLIMELLDKSWEIPKLLLVVSEVLIIV